MPSLSRRVIDDSKTIDGAAERRDGEGSVARFIRGILSRNVISVPLCEPTDRPPTRYIVEWPVFGYENLSARPAVPGEPVYDAAVCATM